MQIYYSLTTTNVSTFTISNKRKELIRNFKNLSFNNNYIFALIFCQSLSFKIGEMIIRNGKEIFSVNNNNNSMIIY